MRVIEHPILGDLEDKKKVTLYYNGEPIEALEGEPIASALMNAGIRVFRRYFLCYRQMYRLHDDRGRHSQHKNVCDCGS